MKMEEEGSEEFDVMCPPTTLLRKVTSTSMFTFSATNFVTQREGLVSDKYVIGEKLGSGGYGEVFACVHKESHIERAVKILPKSPYSDEANEDVHNEFNILKTLDHPNILKQIEMFTDDDNYYIVTEICRGGELFDEIEKWGNFLEEDAAELLSRLLASINYCHKHNVVHRDLKPENILLEENKSLDSIKLIDFGLSKIVELNTELTDMVGSSYYVAPEVLAGSHGSKADIWSCGVIAYILMAGYPPFDGHSDDAIKDAVLEGMVEFEDEIWDEVSEDAKDFILSLLTYDPTSRPSAEEALKHPWIMNCRMASAERLKQRESVNERAMDALYNLERFNAQGKLKQATCAFIASQLVLKEEKQKLDELFNALDINSNGKLTKDDVRVGYKEVFGKEIKDKMVDDMFRRIDYDNTGFIEYSEFVIASMNEKDLLSSDKLRQAFNMFDSDGSGFIDKDELIDILSFFGTVDESLNADVIGRIIEEVDATSQGEIGFDEFTAMMFKTAEKAVEEESAHSKRSQHQILLDNSASGDHSESQTEASFHEDPWNDSQRSNEERQSIPQKKRSFQLPSVKRISGAMGAKACLALFERNIQQNKERNVGHMINGPKRLSIAKRFSMERRRSKPVPTPVNSTYLGEKSIEPLISENTEHNSKTTKDRAAIFEAMVRKKQGSNGESSSQRQKQ